MVTIDKRHYHQKYIKLYTFDKNPNKNLGERNHFAYKNRKFCDF